jgi:hypothetical protein
MFRSYSENNGNLKVKKDKGTMRRERWQDRSPRICTPPHAHI